MWEIGDRVIVVETPEEKNIWRLNISAGDKGTVMAKRDGHCWWSYEEHSYLASCALELKCKWIPKKRNNNFY